MDSNEENLPRIEARLAVPYLICCFAIGFFLGEPWPALSEGDWGKIKLVRELLTALAAIVGLRVVLWRTRIADRQAKTADRQADLVERGQVTERFTKAIGQLGDDKLAVRLGGIYSLEGIAKDSKGDRTAIVEVLCAFVRDWRTREENEGFAQQEPETGGAQDQPRAKRPPAEVLAAVTILADGEARANGLQNLHRDLSDVDFGALDLNDKTLAGLDLQGANFEKTLVRRANLRGATLNNANLVEANLVEAIFEEADLDFATLERAGLLGANLIKANLVYANLTGAYLVSANLTKADLTYACVDDANLDNANLTEANLTFSSLVSANLFNANLSEANLANADLVHTNLTKANLTKANLTKANLGYANLTDADVSGATFEGSNLTQEQLDQARGDRHTILPRGFEMPSEWKGEE